MNNLPWELVAAIGNFLAPKWRCRLFICCRLWYRTCYLAAKDIFTVCKHKLNVIADINRIQYSIAPGNDSDDGISKIIKPNGIPVYSHCYYGNTNNELVINNGSIEFNIVNKGIKTTIYYGRRKLVGSNYDSVEYTYNVYYLSNNDYMCNVYRCLNVLVKYVDRADMTRFSIAFGREILYLYKHNPYLYK